MTSRSSLENKNEIIVSWVNLYTKSLYNWAFFKTSEKESAEDLVQDTFIAAYHQLEKYKQNSSPKTWLLAILNNKIGTYYRNKYKSINQTVSAKTIENQNVTEFFNDKGRWKREELPHEWDADENQLLDNEEFNKILASCLKQLPDNWRIAVNLKYIEQKKGNIICQELEISPTNFWQILHRAKLQLRKCLEFKWFKT